jgi:RimJ/RimL family protein N-acetyltransferase
MEGTNGVRTLQAADAEALIALRKEALESEPLAFAASVEDDRLLSLEFARSLLAGSAESVVLGFWGDGSLVGMVGIYRPRTVKSRHKAQIWGMYVRPAYRRRGVGIGLLRSAIEQARKWPGVTQVHLAVALPAEAARSLYERAGFREWGLEPRARAWAGRFVDERHMVLDLTAPNPSRAPS